MTEIQHVFASTVLDGSLLLAAAVSALAGIVAFLSLIHI